VVDAEARAAKAERPDRIEIQIESHIPVSGASDACESFVGHYQAPTQAFQRIFLQDLPQYLQYGKTAFVAGSHQQDSRMSPGLKAPDVTEVEIEGDQEPAFGENRFPYAFVTGSREPFVMDTISFVTALA